MSPDGARQPQATLGDLLDNSSTFNGTVAGMIANDTIDFADINFATIQTPTFINATATGGTLHVTDGSGPYRRRNQIAAFVA